MTLRTSFKAAILATTVIGLSAADVAAQQLEEITVTARKRAENLQEIPLSITAFTSEAVERAGIKSVQDVVKFTPGLNYDKGFAPQDTRISIRGLPVLRGKPPVGVLVDGIDISSESISTAGGSSLVNLKMVDVDNIAVVKGPQSALYGRSAFGGAVVYTSRKPNLEKVEGNAQIDIASHNFYEGRAAVSFPVVQDKVAVRLNGVYSYFDGFWRNTVSGNVIGGDKFAGGTFAIRFKPAENVDFTFRSSYSDDKSESRPSYYLGTANGLTSTRALPANAVGLRLGTPPGGAALPATWLFPRIGTIDVTGNQVAISVDPLTNKDFEGGRLRPVVNTLVGDIDFGGVKLSSWTGYTTARASGRADADFYGAPVTAVTLPTPGTAENLPAFFISDIKVKASQFSQELRLGNDEGRLKWAVGGLYWLERYKSDNASLSVAASQAKPAGVSVARAHQILGQQPSARSVRNTNHTSGYASLTYGFTDQIEGNVEARYAHEKVDSVLGQALSMLFNASGQPFYAFGAVPINPTPTYTTNMFTPRAVLKYKFDDNNNVYVSFSKGMKPGGYLNVAVVTDSKLARYNPEKIYSYEAGFKSTWLENRLRVNGAYFHAVNKDRLNQVLIPDATSPQGVVTQAVNIGEVKIDGIELEANVAVAEGLTLSAAYSYVNARYTSSDAPQTTAFAIAGPGVCTVATVGPQVVCVTNTNGKQLDFNSKHSFSGSINYTTPLSADWNLNTSIDVQGRSKRFVEANNLLALPGFINADFKIGVDNGAYNVLLYVNNVFNDLKPKSGQTGGDNYALIPPQLVLTAYPADKRQFGLRAGVKF